MARASDTSALSATVAIVAEDGADVWYDRRSSALHFLCSATLDRHVQTSAEHIYREDLAGIEAPRECARCRQIYTLRRSLCRFECSQCLDHAPIFFERAAYVSSLHGSRFAALPSFVYDNEDAPPLQSLAEERDRLRRKHRISMDALLWMAAWTPEERQTLHRDYVLRFDLVAAHPQSVVAAATAARRTIANDPLDDIESAAGLRTVVPYRSTTMSPSPPLPLIDLALSTVVIGTDYYASARHTSES